MTQTLNPKTPIQTMSVRYRGGERYDIAVRGHTLTVDQPADSGGDDAAPTPTELFVASLASCVAFYAGRYLARHGIAREGLSVNATYQMAADRPARVSSVDLTVWVPDTLPAERRPALQKVVEHCTVHNSLATPPTVHIGLESLAAR
jgi:putative redox protein